MYSAGFILNETGRRTHWHHLVNSCWTGENGFKPGPRFLCILHSLNTVNIIKGPIIVRMVYNYKKAGTVTKNC